LGEQTAASPGDESGTRGKAGGRKKARSGGSEKSASRAAARAGREGSDGSGTHVVSSGESLWVIAEGRLGEGASNADIAAEVSRLWELNGKDVIRTGDPNLILPGQELRL